MHRSFGGARRTSATESKYGSGFGRNAVVKSGKLYVVQGQIGPAPFPFMETKAGPADAGWVGCSDSEREFGAR